jgi:hypothetical protein
LCALEKAEGERDDWLGRGLREEVVRPDHRLQSDFIDLRLSAIFDDVDWFCSGIWETN